VPVALDDFDVGADVLRKRCAALVTTTDADAALGDAHKQALRDAQAELDQALGAYETARDTLLTLLQNGDHAEAEVPGDNAGQHAARAALAPTAKALTGLVEHIDGVQRALTRFHALVGKLPKDIAKQQAIKQAYPRTRVAKQLKQLGADRDKAVAHLEHPVYLHQQIGWLHGRFPDARYADVPGLVKRVGHADIEAADWSLTPGRYVGIAAEEDDPDFEFADTMRGIRAGLADLNREASQLATEIDENLARLGW
jgi:type I restriction enzyme M protein